MACKAACTFLGDVVFIPSIKAACHDKKIKILPELSNNSKHLKRKNSR